MQTKQEQVLYKMRDLGWKAVQPLTHPTEGHAFVMRANGVVAILYPDGSLDRQTSPNSSVMPRDGYRDLKAERLHKERQEKADRALSRLLDYFQNMMREAR